MSVVKGLVEKCINGLGELATQVLEFTCTVGNGYRGKLNRLRVGFVRCDLELLVAQVSGSCFSLEPLRWPHGAA
jgi:hypothetical protein